MIRNIVQVGESEVLQQKAKEVSEELFGTEKLAALIKDMKETLEAQEDGVAIAAPQIDISLRIFIVSKRAFAIENHDEENAETYKDLICINPVIKKMSRKKEYMDEGCLSVRGKYGKVERALKTTIVAFDEQGKKFKYGASGLLSQVFQHETDHLDGILFIDKAIDIEEI